ncbi:hypothetical protein [Bacillus sp. FSL R5-0659]|uniref:hypothetical protein n=1 Tax=Bacillus sp. FSL R5-0659 TaxID=2954590 RepID=UPI0030FB9548
MATFESRYKELTFYVGGAPRKFSDGIYATTDPEEIEVLTALVDAVCTAKDEPKTEDKPKPAPAKKPAKKSSTK